MIEPEPPITLHVCTSCRAGTVPVEGVALPGRALFDRVSALLDGAEQPGLRLLGVECLAVCNQGCAASIAAPGKWAYLMGRLSPEKAADLVRFAASYGASLTGTVMPSRRPASLADMVLGRIPSASMGVPA